MAPLLAALLLSSSSPGCWGEVRGEWCSDALPPADRAHALVKRMSLEEKLAMLHGPATGSCCSCNTSASCAYVGNIAANPRLGIPPINMNDGPQGFRDNVHPGTTTAWPSGLTMAATWSVDALREWGEGQGKEFFAKGANVQLGPGLCLARVPRNGRNFEYLSGEDPLLGQTLVQPAIEGIQKYKVVANAKHYALNNQETNRHGVSADVDERTRFEMYYPPFEGAVKSGVGSIMCSYNLINGAWSCENPETLAGDLKQRLGFKGYVMSDWGATHSTSIMAGLDVEMPTAKYMNPAAITAGIQAGNITLRKVDDSVFRILLPMFELGIMDAPRDAYDWAKQSTNCTTEASVASARRLSAESTVLLKNDGLLPLQRGKSIAIIGFGDAGAVVHGGGSGSVVPSFIATPLAGIKAQATGRVTFDDGTDLKRAVEVAKAADVVIVFVGTLSHEGGDRLSLSLDDGCVDDARRAAATQCQGNSKNQNAMVEAIAAANRHTAVVMSVPGAVLTPWVKKVEALLVAWMPGQQFGNAIADVIFGAVNPSAKLPITLPNRENETNFTPAQWPGGPDPATPTHALYSEKLLVGYRYYDHHNISFTTGFPFGHGLSFTTFKYTALQASSTSVSFTLENTGSVAGAEVAQLYLGFPAAAGEPPKQLKGFKKVMLNPNERKTVTLPLSPRDTSIWSTSAKGWAQVDGEFRVYVGSSSRDIRLEGGMRT